MILQRVHPTIPCVVTTPDGKHTARAGEIYFVQEETPDHDTKWGVSFDDTGEFWWIPNPYIRFAFCWSRERPPFKAPITTQQHLKNLKEKGHEKWTQEV